MQKATINTSSSTELRACDPNAVVKRLPVQRATGLRRLLKDASQAPGRKPAHSGTSGIDAGDGREEPVATVDQRLLQLIGFLG
jgi:hypothetical protein